MALLLSDVVICGEIDNRTKNTVCGWIQLRGCDTPLRIELTGNCAEDLSGRCTRFEASHIPLHKTGSPIDIDCLYPHQIGPVGIMTANGRIQVAGCSAEDLLGTTGSGKNTPVRRKQSLFLEWFSQNGRIIVELLDAILLNVDTPPDSALEIPSSRCKMENDERQEDVEGEEPEMDEDDDPYGLFPDDLKEDLMAASPIEPTQTDPFSEEELAEVSRLFEEDIPLWSLFDPPLKIYPSHRLSNQQIGESLHVVLARLARHGVAFHICEHFTLREAYELLTETILPEETIPEEYLETAYVQHYATHDFCSLCLKDSQIDDTRQDPSTDEENDEMH